MGNTTNQDNKKQARLQIASTGQLNQYKKIEKDYDIQVIQVSNIALAIRNKQQTTNVELSLRCQNLPAIKAFGSTDSMVVVLKSDDIGEGGVRNFVEIGRTQIVSNQINPKYIKTFIFPFKGQTRQEQLQFKIFHIINPKSDDLSQQKLIGTVSMNLESLVGNEKDQQEIKQSSKSNSKAILKLNCEQYDGGNSYYQVGIQLAHFNGKSQIYYVIEAWKFGQWIPVARSQIMKNARFKQIKVPYNKFQGEDNSGVRIKVFDAVKEQEIGCTKQFSIIDSTNDQKAQNHRVTHGGSVVGTVIIHKWKKNIRDSFISYIVGGARLHLLLAIDFTNSNAQNIESLHSLDDKGENVYVNAIRQIVGVLQYFSIQNQVALYGFGAKLPPFYKSVSQCFALNGNYFHPNVEGGVQEIIRLYKETLDKIKMHGPTKISDILQLAIKYASQEQMMSTKTSTYYVLLILTDGRINDYQDAVDLIVKASSLPLSILFVGVGDGDQDTQKNMFQALQNLDGGAFSQKSSKTGKVCERDIVDFIRMSDFAKDHTKQTLARQTFAQIPNQFIDYMTIKSIKPLKDKKSLKAAKAQFIAQKIKSNPEKVQPFISSFLQKQKKEMKKKLANLGFNLGDPMIQKMSIAMNDLSYFIEVHSQDKKVKVQQIKEKTQYINIRQVKKLEQYLDRKDQDKRTKTLQKLQKIEGNHYGRRMKVIKKQEQKIMEQVKILDHPCLKCRKQQINVVHMQCGHSSVCYDCYHERCIICYHVNKFYKKFKYNTYGELQCSESDSQNQYD